MDSDIDNGYSIQVKGLTKVFGKRTAVDGIDLSIKKGELFSILGHNGAGKTTTIKMLCCLLRPTAGSASIMGFDLDRNPNDIKKIINVSPQETAVAPHLTVRENLYLMGRIYGFSPTQTALKTEEMMELMAMKDRASEMTKNFSGGMQRKLSIAMALISDPQVLFLDEPTLGLDPQSRRELWEYIAKLKGKKTIILTTHYLEEADALSDRIAIIRSGKLIALGTSEQLKDDLSNKQTMLIRGQNISPSVVDEVKKVYPETRKVDEELEIVSGSLDFNRVVDLIRSKGATIEWLTMKKPTLDDVFLKLANEEEKK